MSHLIVFDFDGVICDSQKTHQKAYEAVFALFNKPWPLTTLDLWRENFRGSWEINYYGNGLTVEETEIAKSRYYDFIDYSDAKVFEHIPELLKQLKKVATLAIVSSTKKEVVLEKLKNHQLSEHFSGIFTDAAQSNKTESLRMATATLGFTSKNTVMIGDTEGDTEAAQALGIPIISVSYGWYTEDRLNSLKPDYIASSPQKIFEILQQIL